MKIMKNNLIKKLKISGAFLRRYKLPHIWLLIDILLLSLYMLCRTNRAWMNILTRELTGPLQAFLGRLCARVNISVMEILTASAVLIAVGYVIYNLIIIIRAKGQENQPRRNQIKWRMKKSYIAVLYGLCAFLSVQALFCLMWGVNFWADSFQDCSGLYARPVSFEDLQAVTAYFAENVSQAADGVERDENGAFAVSREYILSKAPEIYDNLEKIYPFLKFDDVGVKSMAFSRLMSRMDFTGFYCSYTGEANVNIDSPACLLASTCAHEMAHQRGFASEQECNFLAVLACVTSGDPVYTYSGYLMGYIYLGNALWEADQDAYRAIRATLPDTVRADLRENNEYWDQFRDTIVKTVSTKVYDGILKSYGDSRGIRSYGAMVDLLVAYYNGDALAVNNNNYNYNQEAAD